MTRHDAPDSLPDFTDVDTSYEDLLRFVSAAEVRMSASGEPPGKSPGKSPGGTG